jgi:hypothetical protein
MITIVQVTTDRDSEQTKTKKFQRKILGKINSAIKISTQEKITLRILQKNHTHLSGCLRIQLVNLTGQM